MTAQTEPEAAQDQDLAGDGPQATDEAGGPAAAAIDLPLAAALTATTEAATA